MLCQASVHVADKFSEMHDFRTLYLNFYLSLIKNFLALVSQISSDQVKGLSSKLVL